MIIIGLTGGIATGKSTASSWFKERGITVVDADACVAQLQRPGTPVFEAMVAAFGTAILNVDGTLDRKKLAQCIFADANKRQTLEHIVHPAVRRAFQARIAACEDDVLVLDVPLLFEAGFDDLTTFNVVIHTKPETQRLRLMQRDGLSENAAELRIAAQLPLEEKIKRSDFAVANDGNVAQLHAQLEQLLQEVYKKDKVMR